MSSAPSDFIRSLLTSPQVLTWALCSRAENFGHLRRADGGAVAVGEPKTAELEICRTSLLPGPGCARA